MTMSIITKIIVMIGCVDDNNSSRVVVIMLK